MNTKLTHGRPPFTAPAWAACAALLGIPGPVQAQANIKPPQA